MSHRAGLNAPGAPMSLRGLYDRHPAVESFASMAPLWPPGSRCACHAFSFGHIVGETLRRADGRFVAEEIAGPLGPDLHVGPSRDQDYRVARLVASRDMDHWFDDRTRTAYHVRHRRMKPSY